MKKILGALGVVVLILAIILVVISVDFGTKVPEEESEVEIEKTLTIIAKIEEITPLENRIELLLKEENTDYEIRLNSYEDSFIVEATSGAKLEIADLKVGDLVHTYYGPNITRSMPPIGKALAIVGRIQEEETVAKYMQASSITQDENGNIKVLSENEDKIITIPKDAVIYTLKTGESLKTSDIRVGTKMLVWYDIMALSYPAQAGTAKVVILEK